MELHGYVTQVRDQLAAAATLGDETTRRTADVLAAAAEPAVRLALLAAVSAAADEITAALLDAPGSPAVAVRMDGDELRVEVRSTAPAEPATAPAAEDSDASARVSLRLSESLKVEIEAAARSESVSVNAWLVRAAAGALRSRAGSWENRGSWESRGAHRITGWVNG